MARHDVVERELGGALAAVLAEVLVAGEDLASREPHARSRPPDAVLQLDDRWRAQDLTLGVRTMVWSYSMTSAFSPKTRRKALRRSQTLRGS